MSNVEKELQHRVDSFVNELSALIRRQALEAVEEMLKKGEHAGHVTHVARKPGRPAKAAEAHRPAKAAAAVKPLISTKRRAGEKRTPQALAQITEQVYGYIR